MVGSEKDSESRFRPRTEATVVAKDTSGRIVADGGCGGNNVRSDTNMETNGDYDRPRYEDDKLIFPNREKEKEKRDKNRKKNRSKNKMKKKNKIKNRKR